MIVEYIQNEGYITNRVCQELCGFDETQVQYILKKLVVDNEVMLEGKGRGSKYRRTENKRRINREKME